MELSTLKQKIKDTEKAIADIVTTFESECDVKVSDISIFAQEKATEVSNGFYPNTTSVNIITISVTI